MSGYRFVTQIEPKPNRKGKTTGEAKIIMFEYPIEIGNDDLDAAVRLRHCIDLDVLVGNDLLVVLQLVTRRQRV